MLLRASWTIRLYCTWSSNLLKNYTNDFFSLEKWKTSSSIQYCSSVKCFWFICVVYLVYSKFLKTYSFTVIYFARVAWCCPWVRDSCCLYLIIVLLSLFLWKPIMTCIMKQSVYVTTDSSPWDKCYPDEDILAFMFNNQRLSITSRFSTFNSKSAHEYNSECERQVYHTTNKTSDIYVTGASQQRYNS